MIHRVASHLRVPIVKYSEWLERLEQIGRDVGRKLEDVPALKLMDLYRNRTITDGLNGRREVLGIPFLSLSKALQVSPTLSNPALSQLCEADVDGWIQYWRSKQYLSSD